MPEEKTMLEYIRLHPQPHWLAIHPVRAVFKYLLAEFIDLHLAGDTKRIQIDVDRNTLTIKSAGRGFRFSTIRRWGKYEITPDNGCRSGIGMGYFVWVAAAISTKFRISSVHGGHRIVCSVNARHDLICRKEKACSPTGSELYMELDTDFLNRSFSPKDGASVFEPEYVRHLLLEKCALYPNCSFILNGMALPRSSGLVDVLFRNSEEAEYLIPLGSIRCCDESLEIALAYARSQAKREERLVFINGHLAYHDGSSYAFLNGALRGNIYLHGFETALMEVMTKLRGAEEPLDGIHAALHRHLVNDWESESCDVLQRNVASGVYWGLLHSLFPLDEASPTCCFKDRRQTFAEFRKNIWQRLAPLDKESLISAHPELFELLDDPQRELTPDNWLGVLACQPQLEKYFDWSLVEKKPSMSWDFLLCRQPQFADHCDFSQLSGDQIRHILSKQPQLIDRCDWSKIEPSDREKLEAKGIKP